MQFRTRFNEILNEMSFSEPNNSDTDVLDCLDNCDPFNFEFSDTLNTEVCDRASDVSDTHSCHSDNEDNNIVLLPPSKCINNNL